MSYEYIYPPTLLADFYKISHREQYPENTEMIYSTWTPRLSRIEGIKEVVAFGFQAFVKEYLIDYFNVNFFNRPLADVIVEYERVIKFTLGVEHPDSSHIKALHELGYLPLRIKAVKEGTKVPIRVPMLTIENTHIDFFWLTNYIETLASCMLWQPTTSATIANKYREILDFYAKQTGGDMGFVQFQGHDFSMRGMSSLESAKSSGAGHLLSFTGTDSIPAILYMEQFYNANIETEMVGTSIPASEHSVMCAYGRDELESYRHLITKVYPAGFVSIVSDTWNLWSVLRDVIGKLKPEIMARPDSGNPADIVCGNQKSNDPDEFKGVIEILWEIFGGTVNDKGFKQLDTHIGCIYGDAISLIRATEICSRLESKGFASTNMVFGIGSYTYQFNTRDTFGFALKSTFGMFGGEEKNLYKDPITDKDNFKKSQTGLVCVMRDNGIIDYLDGLSFLQREQYEDIDLLEDIFVDGFLVRDESLAEIRKLLRG
jgi:nicotinamide phosphoribosyltransferase